ncbi:MAG: hypothetical protein A2V66_07105 [Ignavibacteria bacterium RBG_13_36_8]|nr:MAG: hypothetical protein A2V66_07105 [Ignavibacteria bacterium RBG_13_36_8]
MNPSFEEIRNDITSNKESLTSILRKSKVLAKKLDLNDFLKWIDYELEGYPDEESLPKYRIISGEMKAWNPYHGYVPIYFANSKVAETLSSKPVYDSIVTIEKICNEHDGKGEIESPIPNSIKIRLLKITNGMEPAFLFNQAQFLSIIDNVKNILLDWLLKLEDKEITSENLNFTQKEKENAKSIVVNITHMNNSQIQLDTINSLQNYNSNEIDIEKILSFLKEMEENISKIALKENVILEIQTDIKTIKTQLESPNPQKGILIESLRSIRNVLEGVAGNIIASGLLYKLNLFMPQ